MAINRHLHAGQRERGFGRLRGRPHHDRDGCGRRLGHGRHRPPGDRDWFAVDLEAGKAYRFDLEGTWTGGGTLYDPYLRGIYDEDGDRSDRIYRTTDDDGGVRRNSRVDFTPDESATYYVSAGADRNYTGTYTLLERSMPCDLADGPHGVRFGAMPTTQRRRVDGRRPGHWHGHVHHD